MYYYRIDANVKQTCPQQGSIERKKEIPIYVSGIVEKLEAINVTIDTLQEVLKPVLQQVPEAAEDVVKKEDNTIPAPACSPVGNTLYGINNCLLNIVARLNDVLNRLEI